MLCLRFPTGSSKDNKIAMRTSSSYEALVQRRFSAVKRRHFTLWREKIRKYTRSLVYCALNEILKKVEIGKFITTALKSILKLVKLQSLVAKRCKMWKM